jgi:signal peptidase II
MMTPDGQEKGERGFSYILMIRSKFLPTVLTIILLDQWLKYWVIKNIPLHEGFSIIPRFFDILHARNTGSAFSLFAESSSFLVRWGLSLISLVALAGILYVFFRFPQLNWIQRWGLTLVWGGAAGNLIDRVRWGYVVDFLDVYAGSYHWPTFNVADSAITVGIILMLWDQLRSKQEPIKPPLP